MSRREIQHFLLNVMSLRKISLRVAHDKKYNDIEMLQKGDKCTVCIDNTIDILYLPCEHLVCCSQCTNKLNACPLCRGIISKSVKLQYNGTN